MSDLSYADYPPPKLSEKSVNFSRTCSNDAFC